MGGEHQVPSYGLGTKSPGTFVNKVGILNRESRFQILNTSYYIILLLLCDLKADGSMEVPSCL